MSPWVRSACVCTAFSILLLAGCGEEDSTAGVPVDETPAALEAPELAPNRLVKDPPERRPPP